MYAKGPLMRKIGLVCFVLVLSVGCVANDEISDCVFYRQGKCFSCDTPEVLEVGTEDNCLKHCPNRVVKRVGRFLGCALKKCPPDKPLRDYSGNCFACDSMALPHTFEDCGVCPGYYKDSEGFCRVKEGMPDHTPRYDYFKNNAIKETYFTQESCPQKGYFYADRECYSCETWQTPSISCEYLDENSKAYASEEDCLTRCPNRVFISDYHSQFEEYSVRKCPPDRPLMDARLMCWRCDEETPIVYDWAGSKDWNDTANVCPGKRYLDTWSFLCPQNKHYLSKEACLQCKGVWKDEKCF